MSQREKRKETGDKRQKIGDHRVRRMKAQGYVIDKKILCGVVIHER